jgi:hypothetical protein
VTMRKGFNWQSCRRLFVPSLLVAALAAVMYFGLVPNRRQEMFGILPLALGRQIGLHDDFNNWAAFTVLGILALRLGRDSADRRSPAQWSPSRPLRMAMLIGLVCAIEAAQIWIPGRYSSLRDVATGSSGVVTAWVLCALVERVVKRRPPK